MPERNLEKERSQKMRAGMKQRHKHLKLVATGITKQRGGKECFLFLRNLSHIYRSLSGQTYTSVRNVFRHTKSYVKY